MDKLRLTLSFCRWLGVGIAAALACLYLVWSLVNPVIGVLLALIYAFFAWGIWRRDAWAAIAASAYQLAPIVTTALQENASTEYRATVLVNFLIRGAIGAGVLVAAVGLWRDRGSAAPWLAVLALPFLWAIFFHYFSLPTRGMQNTLLRGDQVVSERASWLLGRTARNGDIIVFRQPGDRTQRIVKRVVGVSGDHLRMEGTQLYRNGSAVVEDYAVHEGFDHSALDRFPPQEGAPRPPEATETFAGHIENGEVVVPADHCFVLGDYRDDSLDSRHFGFVPQPDILSSPVLIVGSYEVDSYDPTEGRPIPTILNLRWARLLKLVF